MTLSYFEDIEKHIISRLNSSQSSIFVAVAWFTNQLLFDGLMDALKKNVAVKILILDDILNRNEFGLDFGILTKLGAEVRLAKSDKGTMHNKFCIIDDLVITGSYNWTYHANNNDENIIVTDDENVVNSYSEQFNKLFSEGKPLNPPYEHLKWTDIKEGDFTELRRNIFRDVIARNDINKELKRVKLINLNHAYKGGKKEEILAASSLPIIGSFKTITDVLTSRNRDYEFKLWEENILGKPYDNVEGHVFLEEWFFVPFEIKENSYHQKYVEGKLKVFTSRDNMLSKGLKLKVYDEDFIKAIITYCGSKSYVDYELIPINILKIDRAKLFYFPFPCPLYNKGASCTYNKRQPKTISAINVLGIVKEVNGDDVIFYEGWDPQKRGEKIVKEFFTTSRIEQKYKTITDVITNTQKRYVDDLFYETSWDLDEEPADVRYSTIDKWIFIPSEFAENRNHEKYVRGYLHFYKWYKSRKLTYLKIKIDIYDGSFISCIERYLQGSMDISKIPEDVLCINLAKLSIIRLPKPLRIKEKNALAVFCLVREVSENNIIYYEGWNPQQRGQEIIKKLRQG